MANNYEIVLNKLLELNDVNDTDIVLFKHENYKYIYSEKIEDLICNNEKIAHEIGKILQEELVSKENTDFEFYENTQELNKILNDRDYSNKISNSTKFIKCKRYVKSYPKKDKEFKSNNNILKVVA